MPCVCSFLKEEPRYHDHALDIQVLRLTPRARLQIKTPRAQPLASASNFSNLCRRVGNSASAFAGQTRPVEEALVLAYCYTVEILYVERSKWRV